MILQMEPQAIRRLVTNDWWRCVIFWIDLAMRRTTLLMWFGDPPALSVHRWICVSFLKNRVLPPTDLLTEVYLDKFQSFVLLEACEAAAMNGI
jgi:hypothetical protein